MAVHRLASWEKESFNYGVEAAWSGRLGTGGTWSRYRETSGVIPMGFAPRQNVGPLGLGVSYPTAANFHVGKAAGAMSATFPVTPIILNDLASLLVQGKNDATDFIPYTSPEVTKFASVSVELAQASRGADVIASGTSFLLRSMNITIPQNSPGDTGGIVEASSEWIGEEADLDNLSIVTAPPAVVDAGVFLQTRRCIFSLAGTANDFISASINMSNNAALYPDAEALPTGASLGPLNVTGSVTVAGMTDDGAETYSSHDLLLAELEAATVTAKQLEFDWTEDTATQHIEAYAAIMSVTGPVDIGGMQAWTYNWELAYDGTNAPLKIHGGGNTQGVAQALFYVAP